MRLRLGGLNIIGLRTSPMPAMPVLYALDTTLRQYRSVATMLAEDATPTWIVTTGRSGVVKKDKGVSARNAPTASSTSPAGRAHDRVSNDLPPHVTAVIAGHMHPLPGHRASAVATASARCRHRAHGAVRTSSPARRRTIQGPIRVPDLAGAVVTWSASAISARGHEPSARLGALDERLFGTRVRPWRPAIRPGPVRAAD